jgi:hypothetical protein
VAEKFKDWNHLFTTSGDDLEHLGVSIEKRRYIMRWKEWYRRGVEPFEMAVAKRQKKYLKVRKAVQLARLKKQGKA